MLQAARKRTVQSNELDANVQTKSSFTLQLTAWVLTSLTCLASGDKNGCIHKLARAMSNEVPLFQSNELHGKYEDHMIMHILTCYFNLQRCWLKF